MLGKLLARLSQTRDAITRARLVRALAHITEPRLAARAREASLTPAMSASELQTFLREHSMERANQEAAWAWFQANAERVIAKLPPTPFGVGELPRRFADFCSLEKEAELERFFAPRIEKLPGGPRTLRIARETIRLCAATVAAQRESVRAFFSRIDPRTGAERP